MNVILQMNSGLKGDVDRGHMTLMMICNDFFWLLK